MPLDFACDGTALVPVTRGVDTFGLAYADAPAPDVIAIAAAPAGNGLPKDWATRACLAPPAAAITMMIAAGATPSFALFATASSAIPLEPASACVFVRFRGSAGIE